MRETRVGAENGRNPGESGRPLLDATCVSKFNWMREGRNNLKRSYSKAPRGSGGPKSATYPGHRAAVLYKWP